MSAVGQIVESLVRSECAQAAEKERIRLAKCLRKRLQRLSEEAQQELERLAQELDVGGRFDDE